MPKHKHFENCPFGIGDGPIVSLVAWDPAPVKVRAKGQSAVELRAQLLFEIGRGAEGEREISSPERLPSRQ